MLVKVALMASTTVLLYMFRLLGLLVQEREIGWLSPLGIFLVTFHPYFQSGLSSV